ncbi:MAG: L,D-transpeptidase family protein [Defluviitaleaceae bacterium]|nr:L,D-transpeptidase family protein [Defluviitaleaceae bacterium]
MFKIAVMAALLAFSPCQESLTLIIESAVYAQILEDGHIYSDKKMLHPVGNVAKGDVVEVLEDFSATIYKVLTKNGNEGWLASTKIQIYPDAPTDKTSLTPAQLEGFVNSKGYESTTNYLVLVEINRQKTHVFQGSFEAWSLLKSFDCSTGKHTSPTVKGAFTLSQRGDWLYSRRFKSGATHWIRFYKDYLFHSIPMDEKGNIITGEDVVGQKLSNGCVRFLLDDIKWIYQNIPDGTRVVIL